MSIASTTSRNDYLGNGAVGSYAYTFIVFLAADLRVTVRSPDGVETQLTLDVDFSVDEEELGIPAGGEIDLIEAGQDWMDGSGNLVTDWVLTIRRVVELKQETDIRNQGPYYPEIHENQMDRHTMADQQQQDELDRTCKNPETVPSSTFDPTLPANIATANRALITNSAGTGFTLGLTAADAERIFFAGTMAELKDKSAADPTSQRFGHATDLGQLMWYTALPAKGDDGWVPIAGYAI